MSLLIKKGMPCMAARAAVMAIQPPLPSLSLSLYAESSNGPPRNALALKGFFKGKIRVAAVAWRRGRKEIQTISLLPAMRSTHYANSLP